MHEEIPSNPPNQIWISILSEEFNYFNQFDDCTWDVNELITNSIALLKSELNQCSNSTIVQVSTH